MSRPIAFLAVITLLALPARGPEARPRVDQFRKALRLTKKGKHRLAIKAYEALLERKLFRKDVLERVGALYFLVGRFEPARALFLRVTKKHPDYAKGWYFYAYSLRRLGRCEAALGAYRRYLRLRPKDAHPYYGMARCAEAMGRADDALVAYARFIRLGASQKRLARWVLRAGKRRRALLARLAKKRRAAAIANVLAAARKAFRSNELLEAERILKAGLKKLPGALSLVDELATLLIRQRRCADALPVLTRALRTAKSFVSGRYKQALCLRMGRDYAGAERAYRAVLKARPKHPDAHYGLAETLRLAGKLAEALRFYKAYVVIERRPMEQRYVTLARERIAELAPKVAAGSQAKPAPGKSTPRPRAGAPLPANLDPQIRAMIEARKRVLRRQQGLDVGGSGARAATHRTGLSRAERRRRARAEARRRARKRRAEARRRARERRAEARRRRAEARRRRAEARRRRAEARRLAKRRKRARRLAERVLDGRRDRLDPEVLTALQEMAQKAADAGRHARALRIYRRLRELRPADRDLLRKVATAAKAAGRHRVAARALAELHRASPKDLRLLAELRKAQRSAGLPLTPLPLRLILSPELLAGRRALAAGRLAQASRYARAALQKNPKEGRAYVLLGDAALASGKRKRAVAFARRALALKPSLAGPHRILGDFHLRLRDRSRALRQYRRFLAKVSQDPSEAHNLARVKGLAARLSD